MSKTVSTRTHLREKCESVCDAKKSWLITWIGAADHESSEAKRGKDLGPIATALLGGKRYDRVYLLTNYDFERSRAYCDWLKVDPGFKTKI